MLRGISRLRLCWRPILTPVTAQAASAAQRRRFGDPNRSLDRRTLHTRQARAGQVCKRRLKRLGRSGAKEARSWLCCVLMQPRGGQVASTGDLMTKFNPTLASLLRQGRVYF